MSSISSGVMFGGSSARAEIDHASLSNRIDRIEVRLNRIERRLELVDAS